MYVPGGSACAQTSIWRVASALYPRTPPRRHRVKQPHSSYAARVCEHTVRVESRSANPPANQPHPDKRHFTALFTTRDCFQPVAQSRAEICAATAQAVPHPFEIRCDTRV